MFDAANILADGQPAFRLGAVKRLVIGLAGKADEIPATVDKGIERIGFAPCHFLAIGAGDMLPRRVALKRIARNVESDIFGQYDRQLRPRDGECAAKVAVNDRDRRPPIALTRNAPITQPPDGGAFAPAFGLRARGNFAFCFLDRQPVEEVGIDDFAGAGEGFVADKVVSAFVTVGYNARDGQGVFARKVEIALIMRRAAEHRARAIFHQHEIGDIDGQVPIGIKRMADAQPGIIALFLSRFDVGCGCARKRAIGDEVFQTQVSLRTLLRQRMIGGDRGKAGTKDRIGPRREHVKRFFAVGEVEGETQPL